MFYEIDRFRNAGCRGLTWYHVRGMGGSSRRHAAVTTSEVFSNLRAKSM